VACGRRAVSQPQSTSSHTHCHPSTNSLTHALTHSPPTSPTSFLPLCNFQFSISNFPIFDFRFSIFDFQFSIFDFRFSILSLIVIVSLCHCSLSSFAIAKFESSTFVNTEKKNTNSTKTDFRKAAALFHIPFTSINRYLESTKVLNNIWILHRRLRFVLCHSVAQKTGKCNVQFKT